MARVVNRFNPWHTYDSLAPPGVIPGSQSPEKPHSAKKKKKGKLFHFTNIQQTFETSFKD